MNFEKILFKKDLHLFLLSLFAFIFIAIIYLVDNFINSKPSTETIDSLMRKYEQNTPEIQKLEQELVSKIALKKKYEKYLIDETSLKAEIEKVLKGLINAKVIDASVKLIDISSSPFYINVVDVKIFTLKPQNAVKINYILSRIFNIKSFQNNGKDNLTLEIYKKV